MSGPKFGPLLIFAAADWKSDAEPKYSDTAKGF